MSIELNRPYIILTIRDHELAARMVALGICPGTEFRMVRSHKYMSTYIIEVQGREFDLRREELDQIMFQ
ncbi:MAG: ferrous iron transport protein A [Saprospiraceae bacterium]|nr:ferrous iron transport protein A [Saprospiraceae bacterium]